MQRRYVASPGVRPILVTDTITILEAEDAGAIVVSGSHGGVSSAQFVLGRRLAAVFYNDAGIGKDDAGIAGLAILDEVGLPAVAVDHRSAIIGDGADTWSAGIVSRVNDAASAAGIGLGQSVAAAAGLLSHRPVVRTQGVQPQLNRQGRIIGGTEIILIDSISMLRPDAADMIVVSGSHGGAVSAEFAARHRPALTVFNDAGRGKADAGCAALDILARAQLAAVAINCNSGRIGDPADMLDCGIISRTNAPAARIGFETGTSLCSAVAAYLLEHPQPHLYTTEQK